MQLMAGIDCATTVFPADALACAFGEECPRRQRALAVLGGPRRARRARGRRRRRRRRRRRCARPRRRMRKRRGRRAQGASCSRPRALALALPGRSAPRRGRGRHRRLGDAGVVLRAERRSRASSPRCGAATRARSPKAGARARVGCVPRWPRGVDPPGRARRRRRRRRTGARAVGKFVRARRASRGAARRSSRRRRSSSRRPGSRSRPRLGRLRRGRGRRAEAHSASCAPARLTPPLPRLRSPLASLLEAYPRPAADAARRGAEPRRETVDQWVEASRQARPDAGPGGALRSTEFERRAADLDLALRPGARPNLGATRRGRHRGVGASGAQDARVKMRAGSRTAAGRLLIDGVNRGHASQLRTLMGSQVGRKDTAPRHGVFVHRPRPGSEQTLSTLTPASSRLLSRP